MSALPIDLDPGDDVPIRPTSTPTTADRVFSALATGAGAVSLIIILTTFVFLVKESQPALRASGTWSFFTSSIWNPAAGRFGVFGLVMGTIIIGAIAMVIAVPTSLAMALFINEFAPPRFKAILTSTMDLLAALPSLLYGLWAIFARFTKWWTYPLLWLTPLLTVTSGVLVTRNYLDHALVGEELEAYPDRRVSVDASVLEGTNISPYNMNWHAEHHLFPWIPARKLPEAARRLSSRPDSPDRLVRRSYVGALISHLKNLP